MRVFISADIEGISGVCNQEQTHAGSVEYERARLLMTEEVNAVVEGVLEGGANEVWVADGHGTYRNIELEKLHSAACLVSGKPRFLGMMGGIDRGTWDGVFMIGYHARAGQNGVLAHTINSSAFAEIRVNGVPAAEFLLNGLVAGSFGAPVRMLSGDDCLKAEAEQFFPKARIVVTKLALGNRAAVHFPVARVRRELREAACRAMSDPAEPLVMPGPFVVEVDTVRSFHVDAFAMLPGVRKLGPRTVTFEAGNPVDMGRMLNSFSTIAASL